MEQQHYHHHPLPSASLHPHEPHTRVSQQVFQNQQPGMAQREQLPGHPQTSAVQQQGSRQYQGYVPQQHQFQAQEMLSGPAGNRQELNPEKVSMRASDSQTSSLPRHLQPRPPPQQRNSSPRRQQNEQEQYSKQHYYKPAAAYTPGLQADTSGSGSRPPSSAAGPSFPQAPGDMPMHNMPQVPPTAFQSAASYDHVGSSAPTAPGPAYAPSAGVPRQGALLGSQQPQAWYQMPPQQVNPQQQPQANAPLEQPQSLNKQPLSQESQHHYQQPLQSVQPQHYQFGEGGVQIQSSHSQHVHLDEGGNLQNAVHGPAPMPQPHPPPVQQPPFAATGFNMSQGMVYMSSEGLVFPPPPAAPLQVPSMDPQADLTNYMRQLPHVTQQPVSIQVDSKGQVMLVSMASSEQLGVLPTAEVQVGPGPGPSVPSTSGIPSPMYAGTGQMPQGQSGLASAPSGHAGPAPPRYSEPGLPQQPANRGRMSESPPQPAPEPTNWPQQRHHMHQEPPYGGSAQDERAPPQRPLRAHEEAMPSRPYESERPYGRQQDAHAGPRREETGSRRNDAYARRSEAPHRVGDQRNQLAEGHRNKEERRDAEGRRHPEDRRQAEEHRHAESSARTRQVDARLGNDTTGRRTDSRRPTPVHVDTEVCPSRTAPSRTQSAERGAPQPAERSECAEDVRAGGRPGGRSEPPQREVAPSKGTCSAAKAKKAVECEAKLSLQEAIKRCETLECTLQLTRTDEQLRASTLPGLLNVCEERLADLSLAIKQAEAEAAVAEAVAAEAEAGAVAAAAALAELDNVCEEEDDLGPDVPMGHLAFLLDRSVRSVWPLEIPEHQLLRTCAEALLLEADDGRVASVNNEEVQLQPYELVGATLCNIPGVLEKSALVRAKMSSTSTMQMLRSNSMFDVREHKSRQDYKSSQWLVRLRVERLPSYGQLKSILRASVDALLAPHPHRTEGQQQTSLSRGASPPSGSRARSAGSSGGGTGSLYSITAKDSESSEERQVLRCVALFAVDCKDRKQGLFCFMPKQAVGALPLNLAEKYGGQRLEKLTNLMLGYPIFRNSPRPDLQMSNRICLYTNPLLELQYRLREMQQESRGSKKRRLADGSAGGAGDDEIMKELEQWWQKVRSPRSS